MPRSRVTLPLLLLIVAAIRLGAQVPGCSSTVTGDLRLHTLRSVIFDNSRTIRVLVPPGYDDPANATRRYPVLYLLDGQNLFDACLSDVSHREWQVDETVDRLVLAGRIPPMIVVGIDHMGRDRAHEFLPYRDMLYDPFGREPAGKRFPEFLVSEVMPLVNGTYRTLTGHDHTGIGGSSYGGVAALYALIAAPQYFGYGLIESPSLHVGMGQLVRDTGPLVASPRRVFLGVGDHETDDPEFNARMVALVRAVVANFRAAGHGDSTVRLEITPGARHSEEAWARRLPDALAFLYGP